MALTSEQRTRIGRPIVETRVCPICGKEFGVTCFQKRKVYCDVCKEQHYIDAQKEYREKNREKLRAYGRAYGRETYGPKKAKTYTCSLCGKKFSPGTGGKCKYCIECLWDRRYEKPYRQYLFKRKEYDKIKKELKER